MATAAQAQATPTTTDPIENWLARRAAVNRAVFGTPEDHKQKLLVEVAALVGVSA